MVFCEQIDESSAIIKCPDGEIDLETFKKRNPYMYNYAIEKIEKIREEFLKGNV